MGVGEGMMKKKQIRRGCVTLALLISAFFLTSFYLAAGSVKVVLGNNVFATESMEIGILGNGQSSEIKFTNYTENENFAEPGMRLVGNFTVKNDSTFAVYYRLRFTKVDGDLADVMQATIKTKEGSVLCGPYTVKELTDRSLFTVCELGAKSSVELQLELYFPEGTGNEAQNKTLSCELAADMTQKRNNPDKYFEGDEGVQHPTDIKNDPTSANGNNG